MKAMQDQKAEEPVADASADAETEAPPHVDEVTKEKPAQEARKRLASAGGH